MNRHLTTTFPLGDGDPADPLVLSPLAYNPLAFDNHQVSVNGLDGGTYSVDVLLPGDATYQVHQTGAAEGDSVVCNVLKVAGLQVRFSGLVAHPVPVVTLTSWS